MLGLAKAGVCVRFPSQSESALLRTTWSAVVASSIVIKQTHTWTHIHGTNPPVLSTLAEELTPEVRGVLEQAIEKIKAQEAEAREKVPV